MKNNKLPTPDEKLQDLVIRIKPSTLLTVILVSVGLLLAYAQGRASYQGSTSVPSLKPILSESPTPSPSPKTETVTNVPKNNNMNVTCTGPDGKQFQTTQTECDKFNKAWGNTSTSSPDPNEIVKCAIHADCGGGYKEMAKSTCDQMTCCKMIMSDGKIAWEFASKSSCSTKQSDNFYEYCAGPCKSSYEANMTRCNAMTDYSAKLECSRSAGETNSMCMKPCY